MFGVNEMRRHAATMEGAMHSVNSVIKSKSKMDCMHDVRCPSIPDCVRAIVCGRWASKRYALQCDMEVNVNIKWIWSNGSTHASSARLQWTNAIDASTDWHRLHLIRVPNVATQSVAKDDIEVMTIGCKQICDLSSKSKWKRFRCSMRVDVDVDRDASMAIVNQMGSSVTIFFIFPTHICISHAHALARATKN